MTDILRQPFERFFKHESSSGILLLLATAIALILANSPLAEIYNSLLHTHISIGAGKFSLSKETIHWINDGLMAIFFFVIGLEIKREILVGELSSKAKASLPIFAAIGGVVVPVLVFLLINTNPETLSGWAIPMATDIAFSIGILNLLGKRVPYGLKVFLVAFAIVDDLIAIITIAAFYSEEINWTLVISALAIFGSLLLLSRFKLYNRYLFLFIGLIMWYLFLKSGVHATIAGVLMALTIPMRRAIRLKEVEEGIKEAMSTLRDCQPGKVLLTHEQLSAFDSIETLGKKAISPLQYLENRLHGWVAFGIMPIFAFANAGVDLSSFDPTLINFSSAIALGLLVGKFLGIGFFSWLGIRLGIATLPEGINLKQIFAVGILGGIGFTMSLFFTSLAFSEAALINAAKFGIILGSFVAAVSGYLAVKSTLGQKAQARRLQNEP